MRVVGISLSRIVRRLAIVVVLVLVVLRVVTMPWSIALGLVVASSATPSFVTRVPLIAISRVVIVTSPLGVVVLSTLGVDHLS